MLLWSLGLLTLGFGGLTLLYYRKVFPRKVSRLEKETLESTRDSFRRTLLDEKDQTVQSVIVVRISDIDSELRGDRSEILNFLLWVGSMLCIGAGIVCLLLFFFLSK